MSTAAATTNTTSTPSVATQESQFLTSFVTELQNQDPTDPVSTTEFASQMAQFTMIEQQLNTNTDLTSIISLLSGGTSTGTALSYLGANVEVSSTDNEAPIQNGSVAWSYTLPSDAATVDLTVTDANGDVVSQSTGETATGTYKYALSDTESADNGQSLFLTVTATDSSGNAITPTVYSYATVDSIDNTSGTTMLEAGLMSFAPSTVMRVNAATTSTTNTADSSDDSNDSTTDTNS
jgi:flagellar basal-body rod modification protein FlgD